MGFFSFLSRRTGNRGKTKAAFKAEPYDSALSRSRQTQDGYYLTGNIPDADDTLPRGRAAFDHSQLSLDTASDDEHPAPAPGIPRLRDESVERPSTAPDARPSSAVIPNSSPRVKRNGQTRPPPLSFRMARPETAAPGSRPSSRGSINTITSAFRRASGHSRAMSLRRDGEKAFKDILDAQSEIKPADFKTRVKAAGARDYGEDVAERNMGQNGFDLGSEHVRAFYTESERARPDPYKAGVRRRSLRSSQHILPSRVSASPLLPSPKPITRGKDSARRRSVISYVPLNLGSSNPDSLGDLSPRTPAPDDDKLDFGFSPRVVRPPTEFHPPDIAPAPMVRTTRRPRDSVELAKKRAEVPMPEDHVGDDLPATDFALWSATRSRRSSAIISTTSFIRRHHSLHTLQPSVLSSATSRDTVAHAMPLPYRPKTALQHQVQGAPERFTHRVSLIFENDDALSTVGSTSAPSLKIREADTRPSRSFPLLPSAVVTNTADITIPNDEILEFPPPIRTRGTRGWSASSGTPTACESTTAASTAASTFHRPPSLHTADTSVDLSVGTRSPASKPSTRSTTHDSDGDDDDDDTKPGNTTLCALLDAQETFDVDAYLSSSSIYSFPHTLDDDRNKNDIDTLPPGTHAIIDSTAAMAMVDHFNMDDYLSSDDVDSLRSTTPNHQHHHHRRRPTGEGEEELLFNDLWRCRGGGGVNGGMQLPGLADLFPSPSASPPAFTAAAAATSSSSRERRRRRRFSVGGDGGRQQQQQQQKRFVLDTAADYDYDEEEEEEDESEDGGGGGGWQQEKESAAERRRQYRRDLTPRRDDDGAVDGADDDEGYEADFVDDDDEERLSRRRRQQRTKRTRRLSALCRLGGEEEEEGRQQDGQLNRETEEAEKVDVLTAVRLRKQVRRARRLAGQPSAAMLRRKGSGSRRERARASRSQV
ncbi:hypothetical protein C8A00DRAFT_13179 [Chaetomidium leptoderma]|uniref:Uncharacterized protein n=1 Tax=Chaetomidium leptoderma TaxID=669021 RepID=A0AAN6VT36_9PEZI|nr:hypothetical protein C8A00DRAFT_13179 [Chaetomidium leptoderma]